jgi:hypothetical protein
MRVRLRILVPGLALAFADQTSGERGLWVVGDRLVGSGSDDLAYAAPRFRLTRSTTCSRRR